MFALIPMPSNPCARCLPLRRLISFVLAAVVCASLPAWAAPPPATGQDLTAIRRYISSAWDSLTRSMASCQSVVDPKIAATPVLYLPAELALPPAVEQMQKECHVDVEHLPRPIRRPGEMADTPFDPPGLLYLENKYVVPGGRFNEMYGWDSYFIIRGLLRDGRTALAKGMVENFFFEIEHYGTVLNANRTYFLSRSQPPFLSSMVLAVYEAEKAEGHADLKWLARANGYVERDYQLWTHEPHLAGSTGLSRYFDFGTGPAPEGLKDETGFYRKVAAYFLLHPAEADSYLVQTTDPSAKTPTVGLSYSVQVCDVAKTMAKSECEAGSTVSLSPDYYKGDRSMRESGFDVSFRFGPFSAATHHYAPVCLNSLLYKTEKDLETMNRLLGRESDAAAWSKRAEERKQLMMKYLWNAKRGLFVDYNFDTQSQSNYEYITTYYPLWAGLATPEQGKAVEQNLSIFEHPGGLAMSHYDSGGQWDLPYGWAPTQLLAIEGLRRYGFTADADRVSYEFLSTVLENFKRDGNIREKYNVVTRSSESHVTAGYQINVIGFGWTNAVFLELLHSLSPSWQQRLAEDQGVPSQQAVR